MNRVPDFLNTMICPPAFILTSLPSMTARTMFEHNSMHSPGHLASIKALFVYRPFISTCNPNRLHNARRSRRECFRDLMTGLFNIHLYILGIDLIPFTGPPDTLLYTPDVYLSCINASGISVLGSVWIWRIVKYIIHYFVLGNSPKLFPFIIFHNIKPESNCPIIKAPHRYNDCASIISRDARYLSGT